MQGQSQQGVLDGILFGTFHVRVISLTFLCALLDGLDLQIIAYVAPVIAKALSLSDMEIGLTFSMGFVGLAVGSIFIASLGDSWGRKTVIILSIVFFSSLILITPFARNFEQLAAVRFLTGVGLGGVLPNAMAISIEYAPRRYRSFMLILAYIGFVAGAAVGVV
jgi:AAHS family 4-hydroxybenzoate transporter-like MFS transporter